MQLNIKWFAPAVFLSLAALAPAMEKLSGDETGDLGMWIWRRGQVVNEDERNAMLDFSRKWGVRRLLVQIRFEEKSGGGLEVADQAEWQLLLKAASESGIAVEALDGEASMGLADRRAETLARLDAILAFQASLPEGRKLAGVHYDIEPYLTARWKEGGKQEVARENLETMQMIREKVTPESGLLLAYDIPAFYDRHADALTFEFNGATKNFHEHIQDLSDYIGVMSYRRSATGPNSILDISDAELAYGAKIGRKVYPSIETGQLKDEAAISFYGQPTEQFVDTLRKVQEAGAKSPAFGGVFLHHYEGVRALMEKKE